MTPEQSFNAWLQGVFSEKDEDFVRIENTIGNGTPDINVCCRGIDIWIESKVIAGVVILRKEQYAWGVRRSACGGGVYVVNFNMNQQTIEVFAHPFQVKIRGTDCKYVDIVSYPEHVLHKHDPKIKKQLKKVLYPMF